MPKWEHQLRQQLIKLSLSVIDIDHRQNYFSLIYYVAFIWCIGDVTNAAKTKD